MISLNSALRLSKWAFPFQKDNIDDIALYHALNVEVVFLEKRFERIIHLLKLGTTLEFLIQEYKGSHKQSLQEIITELVNQGLVVEINTDDIYLLEEKRKEYIRPVGLETLYLMLTDQCNLRCSYCFINNNMPTNYKHNTMSWDVAKDAIDMYFFNLSNNPSSYEGFLKTIIFYGGEPFMNFELIKNSIEYVKSKYHREIEMMGDNFRFSTITNGTLIDKNVVAFLSQHKNIAVGVSIDGDQAIHNQKRKYRNGLGSFNKAIEGCLLLKEAGYDNISISCTVGDHNIDNLESLLELHEKYGFMSINLNLMLDTEQNRISHEYMTKLSIKMLQYFELARERGIYEDRVIRKLKAFISHRIHPFDCQATGKQIVCSPDGQLGLCHEGIGSKNFFFVDVSRHFDFHNNSLVQEWNSRSPLNMPQCFDCPAIGICGGGCAYGAWLRNGSIWSIDDRFCIHSLSTVEWLIWDVYKTFK